MTNQIIDNNGNSESEPIQASTIANPCPEHLYAMFSKMAYQTWGNTPDLSQLGNDFSIQEKLFLTKHYQVIDKISLFSGFKACWIGEIDDKEPTGKYIYSISGTTPFSRGSIIDYIEDTRIGTYGLAINQFINAYNYYQEMTHAPNDIIYKIYQSDSLSLNTNFISFGTPLHVTYYYLEETVNTNSNGKTTCANNLTLTGHSLGGHLAALMSLITGKQAYIYNAPGYSDFNTKLIQKQLFFVTANGEMTELSSFVEAFQILLNAVGNTPKLTHVYNANGWDFASAIHRLSVAQTVNCLYNGINPLEYHGIGGICASYYAYEQLKDLMTGANCFFGNNSLTTFHDAFLNLYKAFCQMTPHTYSEPDFSEHTAIEDLVTVIKNWADACREANITITADSFNQSASLPVNGTSDQDIVYTGGGIDTVNSGAGNDIVYGGDFFNDKADPKSTRTVDLGDGNDEYYATTGNDFVYAGEGNDYIDTGAGNDTVDTKRNANKENTNTVFLGAGSDTFTGGCATDIVDGGVAGDTEDDTNTVELGEGEDQYKGGAGNDFVSAGPDRDFINAGGGDDYLFGDGGNDRIFATSGHNLIFGGSGKDYIIGGSDVDNINGDENDDEIYGGDGDDFINGGSGDDVIYGGTGNDKIWTGSGRDFVNAGSGINHIYRNDDNNAKGFYIGGTGTDHIYGAKNLDRIFISTSYASYQPEGRNLVITLPSGKTAILHNFFLPDKQNPDGNPSRPYAAGAPFVITPDRHIHGYSVIAGGYVYTGQDLPEKEMPDPKDGDQVPPIPDEPPVSGEDPEDPGDDDTPDKDDKKQDKPLVPWDPISGKPFSGSLLDWDALYPSLPLDALRDLFRQAETTRSPLIIDLDGTSLETLPANSGIYFDHDGNSFAEKTGWAAPHEGILVRDLNGNGQIDDGTELFGDSTVLSNGGKAANGFEALKELDSDNNGVFDPNDAAWNEVKVWNDANSDAKVDNGELLTLEEAGVQSIGLDYRSGGKL